VGVAVDPLDRPIGTSGLPRAALLRRVGRRLGIHTVRDLLFHLPRRYDDLRRISTIGELMSLPDGELVSARVQVTGLRVEQTWRRRVQRTIATLADETGTAEATWFGRRFIERRLREGDRIVVSGRLKHRGFLPLIDNPDFSPDQAAEQALHAGRIVPVYPLTAGLTARSLRMAIRGALDGPGAAYREYLPDDILAAERLVPIDRALEDVHFPSDFEALDAALRRLAFDELLAIQLGMVARRRVRGTAQGPAVIVADADDERIRAGITTALASRIGRMAELTDDQLRAMDEVRADLARGVPMLRLIQGDVGSGKTAVAAHALAAVAGTGAQGALLAPTDLLARQHAETVGALLEPLGIGVTLVTGSLPADARRRAHDLVRSGQARVVVGTHALFSESLDFADLALTIVDEQHRFGVAQRAALEAKAGARAPHVMLMTATPIPRTIGQVLYADLDVSDLRTLPAGRVPIRTAIRHPDELGPLWRFVAEEAAAGHRTFVVVPLIGDDEATDDLAASPDAAAAAEAEAARLTALLASPASLGAAGPDRALRVGLVHGRLRAADRDEEMTRFRDGELDVLVGTTVVEVGVDVPAATVMVVESAERFGLAQLHQLRGRVGRGKAPSYCALVSDAPPDTIGWARLEAARTILDGFELAERDLELRGEGDVLGFAQSGLPPLRVASLQRSDHRDLALHTRRWADELVDAGGVIGGSDVLRRELEAGWLARLAAAEPASGA
jgi:ATP-dependent DNA helicase RecG